MYVHVNTAVFPSCVLNYQRKMKQSSVSVFSKTTLSHAMDKEAKLLTEWKFIAHRKRPQKVKEAEHPKQESYEQDSRVNICQIMTELVKYLKRKLLLLQ